jgi:hypothetical protein
MVYGAALNYCRIPEYSGRFAPVASMRRGLDMVELRKKASCKFRNYSTTLLEDSILSKESKQ